MTRNLILVPAFEGKSLHKVPRPKKNPNNNGTSRPVTREPEKAVALALSELKTVIAHARQLIGPHSFAASTQQWFSNLLATLEEIEVVHETGELHVGPVAVAKNGDLLSSLRSILDEEGTLGGDLPTEWDDSILEFVDGMLDYWTSVVRLHGDAFFGLLAGAIPPHEVIHSIEALSRVRYLTQVKASESVSLPEELSGSNRMQPSRPQRYAGFLDPADMDMDGRLDVKEFILRGEEIGFTVTSVSKEVGHWTISSVAYLQEDGTYLAKKQISSALTAKAELPWDVVIREVVPERDMLDVSGCIRWGASTWEFEGTLELLA